MKNKLAEHESIASLVAEYAVIHARMCREPEPSADEQQIMASREAEIASILRAFGLLPNGRHR